jgi:hypothetical protein
MFARLSAIRFGRELIRIGVSRRRSRDHMALLSTDGMRAINQASRPSALDASRQTIEQTQPLGPTAAPRAYESRPKAAARKAHDSDADPEFDAVAIAEPDKRRHGIPPDAAVRHQSRRTNHQQIIDHALHERENYPFWTPVSNNLGPFSVFRGSSARH